MIVVFLKGGFAIRVSLVLRASVSSLPAGKQVRACCVTFFLEETENAREPNGQRGQDILRPIASAIIRTSLMSWSN